MALTTAFLIATAVKVAVAAAVSISLQIAQQVLTKKPKVDVDSLDFEQTLTRRIRPGLPLEVLVGRRIVAGIGYFDDSYGNRRENALSVTVLSAKPCTAFHTLYGDGEELTLSGDPTQGEVLVTSHYLGLEGARRARVRIFLGNDNSGLGAYLNSKMPGSFAVTDNFGDMCVLVSDCRNTNDDIDEDSGESHIPFTNLPDFKAEMSGAVICDLSIPGASYEDESTYVYTDNSALIDAQYDYGFYSGIGTNRRLIVGNGHPVELMNPSIIAQSAAYCDNEGFTCSGLLRSGNNGDQEEIWKTFNGDRVESASQVYTIPEGDRGEPALLDLSLYPSAYITEYDNEGLSTEVYNGIQTSYSERREQFGEKELPLLTRPEWITDDNFIPRETSLPLLFVTDMLPAAKLQKQEIEISRKPATATLSDLPFGFIGSRVGSMIRLMNSDIDEINDRVWIINGIGNNIRGDVTFSLREYAGADAFTFNPVTETPTVDISNPEPRPWTEWFTPINLGSGVTDTRAIAVSGSYMKPSNLIITGVDNGTDVTINIPAHTRVYANSSVFNDVDFAASTMSGLNYDTTYHLYYDDPNLNGMRGGATQIPFIATTDLDNVSFSDANPYRHYIGSVTTPAAGGVDTEGGGGTLPVIRGVLFDTR